MRKLSLPELLRNIAAFAAVSASGLDAGLLLADRTNTLRVDPSAYINVPLGVWFLTSIPVSIHLVNRIINQVDPHPGRIRAYAENITSPLVRSIPWTINGRQSALLANTAISPNANPDKSHQPVMWQVPVNNQDVRVRESELKAFLDVCHKRNRHQFSRRYWTRTRRPPLPELRYNALMRLLDESGLVENRTVGSSGRLVVFPREAIMYLKYESRFSI